MLSMLTSAPWLQFNPLSLMNGIKALRRPTRGMWRSSIYRATLVGWELTLATQCDSAPPTTKV